MFQSFARKLLVLGGFAALAAVQPAEASIVITSTAFDAGSRAGTISFSPTNLSDAVSVGRFKLTGYDDVTNKAVSFLTYCVDLFQPLGTGTYSTVSLANSGLSATKQGQLNALIANTATTATTATSSAAVQLAVWELIYEYRTNSDYSLTGGYLTASGSDLSSARTLANSYVSNIAQGIWTADSSYTLGFLSSGSKQDQLYYSRTAGDNAGAVPEPASWAMMVGGFGMMGATMRRRRPATVAAV